MKLSIVATLYKSAPYIEEFCRRAGAAAKTIVGNAYEIVLVNDGSPDNSLDLSVTLCESDMHIVVVDLSRNFGHHKAMMTGLAHTRGEQVFLIDSDLEEEPEWLLSFAKQMAQESCDVVYGVQEQRKGRIFERWSGWLFYRLFRLLTKLEVPKNIVTARLMSRRYVQALLRHEEREVNIGGLWHITGFDQRSQLIKKHNTSETTYTLRRKMSILIDAVTSFSNAPLVGIFYFGASISAAAAMYAAYLIASYLVYTRPLSGYTSIMASIWLLGGLIISFIGVVGIYLSKIYSETKRRPYTIVRHVYGNVNH
jgi:putative glycosyltransferase